MSRRALYRCVIVIGVALLAVPVTLAGAVIGATKGVRGLVRLFHREWKEARKI